jgi:hypothetical protein
LRERSAAKVYVFDEQVGGDHIVVPAPSFEHGGIVADALNESIRLA